MPTVRVQVAIQRISRLPVDQAENTFHFEVPLPQPLSSELAAIEAAVIEFYNTPPVGLQNVAFYMSNLVAPGSVHTIKMYALSQPKPRPPMFSSSFALVGPNGSGLPAEVACCLSYRSAQAAGVPPARRRGRIYIGPLSQGTVSSQITNSDVKPSDGLINTLLASGERLMNRSDAKWSVYSQIDQVSREILQVSVDNAFDTQRRRGGAPTARTVRSAAP
jgi:hypothetical protein